MIGCSHDFRAPGQEGADLFFNTSRLISSSIRISNSTDRSSNSIVRLLNVFVSSGISTITGVRWRPWHRFFHNGRAGQGDRYGQQSGCSGIFPGRCQVHIDF